MRLINIHFLPRSVCASVVLMLIRDYLGYILCFLYLTNFFLVICSICIKIISYNFLDLVHKVLVRTGNISDKRHSDFVSSNLHITSITEDEQVFTQYAVSVHSQSSRLF